MVLVLVSNQKLETGEPEELSQAKISQVENIIHTWDHICVLFCKIAIYCLYINIILCILLTIFMLPPDFSNQPTNVNLMIRSKNLRRLWYELCIVCMVILCIMLIKCKLHNIQSKNEKHLNKRKLTLKAINKSAYSTIQITLCTIICIMLMKCNAYAKAYKLKNTRKDRSNSYRKFVAILQFFYSCC
jgi:hypothetical protein